MRHAIRYLPAFLALLIPLLGLAFLGSQELARLQDRAESSMRAHALDYLSTAVDAFDTALEAECVRLEVAFDREAQDLVAETRRCQTDHPQLLEIVVLDDDARVVHPSGAGGRWRTEWLQIATPGPRPGRSGSRPDPVAEDLLLARILSARSQPDRALATLERIESRSPDSDDPQDLTVLLQIAAAQRAAGDLPAALRSFRKLCEALPAPGGERARRSSRGRRPGRGWRFDSYDRPHLELLAHTGLAELTRAVEGRDDAALQLLADIGASRFGETSDSFLEAVLTRIATPLAAAHAEAVERARLGLAHYLSGRRLVRELGLHRDRPLATRLRDAKAGELVMQVRDTELATCLLVADVLTPSQAERLGGRWIGFVLDLGSFVNRQLPDPDDHGHHEFELEVLDPRGRRLLRRGPDTVDPRGDVPSLAASAGLQFHAIPRNAAALIESRRASARNSALLVLALCLVAGGGAFFLVRSVGREAQLAQMKVDLVSRVSHELKTPLAMIKMYGETLAMGRTSGAEQSARFAGIITRESDRLTVMIDRILDFSKQQAGNMAYHAHEVDLAALVRRVTDGYRPHVEAAGLTLNVTAEGPLWVRVDPESMESALVNLLENAVKYTPASSDRREIDVLARTARGGHVVEVRDRGVGVPPAERKQIFSSFYRATTAGEIRGAGLGLSLVHHFVTAHDGQIEALPRDGGGTVFRLTLAPLEHDRGHDDGT